MCSRSIVNGHLLIFILCFISTIISGQHDEEEICKKKNSSVAVWTCRKIADCKLSTKLLGTSQEYRCGANKRDGKICCPEKPDPGQKLTKATTSPSSPGTKPSSKPTLPTTSSSVPKYIQIINEKCTDFAKARYHNVCIGGDIIGQEPNCTLEMDCKQITETLIVDGNTTTEKEFPHMALIGYGEDDISELQWNCGGSLISERFILTAAHCTKHPKQPRWAGLGLLYREMFTENVLHTNVFPIARTHIHPGYKGSYENNDIALFELKNPVAFTAFIRPVCLHTEPDIPPHAQDNATILGWGKIGAGFVESEALMKATIAFLPSVTCSAIYAHEAKLQNGFDGKTMICAGDRGIKEEGSFKDTCQGDSGGPIQMNHKEECMYLQAGITSMGADYCGNGNPAIYTRVYPYLEWIQKIVWPQKGTRV